MPGGRRNPFSMTNIVEHFRTHQSFLNKKGHSSNSEEYYDGPYVDLCIQVSSFSLFQKFISRKWLVSVFFLDS